MTYDYTPKNHASIAAAAAVLKSDKVCRIVLEPGDMTRYEFLMILMTPETASGGYRGGEVAHVAVNNKSDGRFFALHPGREVWTYDFKSYQNDHMRQIMAQFYNLLWKEFSP